MAKPLGQQRKLKTKLQAYEAAAASSLKIGILKVARRFDRLSAWSLVIIFVHRIYVRTVRFQQLFSFCTFDSFLGCLHTLQKLSLCAMHFALLKQPINIHTEPCTGPFWAVLKLLSKS